MNKLYSCSKKSAFNLSTKTLHVDCDYSNKTEKSLKICSYKKTMEEKYCTTTRTTLYTQ